MLGRLITAASDPPHAASASRQGNFPTRAPRGEVASDSATAASASATAAQFIHLLLPSRSGAFAMELAMPFRSSMWLLSDIEGEDPVLHLLEPRSRFWGKSFDFFV